MTTLNKSRITSIDLLRGFIMIIMALDHVRDYFHAGAFLYDPLDLEKTSVPLFLTRWITHFCAPVFMLLAGTSAFISGQRKTKKELSLFLLKRGAWLILLEMVVVNFGWNFMVTFPNLLLIVIWALGISMIVLAAFIHLPKQLILAVGIILVAGHNLLDNIHVSGNDLPAFGWSLLHEQRFFNWHGEGILVGYPLLPWIGIMALGYCLGHLYATGYDIGKRKKNLLLIGFSAITLFILIRCINGYGDHSHWSSQKNSFYTLLSFIKVTKYPPSLLYTLMTLGPAIVFLAFTENLKGTVVSIISIYGRVPMFYYILHIYLIHLLAMIASEVFTNVDWKNWMLTQPLWFNDSLKGYGFSLGVVYLVWFIVVIGLYPLCKRYDRYKQTHKEKWWLSYL
ncbi:MAG: heparan-alpha-glucosaminide N-acetyltransferase domain-containing protein [Ferruginibacter sp.]